MTPRPNILALSCLFPNRAQPNYGIFVLNRLRAVNESCNVKVIAPIPWFPLVSRLRHGSRTSLIPRDDVVGQISVYYPRFASIPRFFKWFDALSYFRTVRPLVARLREFFEFDLVDVHWTYPDIFAGSLLARRYGKKVIVTVRGKEALYPGESTLRRRILIHFLRKADFVITLSAELSDLVLELGVDPQRTAVVLNGVDLSSFGARDRQACRQRLGLPAQKKIMVSVGSLIERKGHHHLVRIMPNLSRTDDVELYVIGAGGGAEGDFSRTLRDMIAERGLTNVHLVGKVDHKMLCDWYNAADLFCLPTSGEGCPNVMLEALACGTPVVATDVGAIGDVVQPGKNGFVVPIAQLGSLEDVVRRALNHEWNRAEIAAAMAGWGWSACAEQVIDIYRTVLGRKV